MAAATPPYSIKSFSTLVPAISFAISLRFLFISLSPCDRFGSAHRHTRPMQAVVVSLETGPFLYYNHFHLSSPAGLAVLSAFDKLTVFPDVLLNNHERQYAEPNLRYLLQMHAPVPAGDRGRAVFPESPHPPGPHWEYQILGLAASGIQKSDVPANLCYTS